MKAKIVNLSNRPRTHWATVTFPAALASSFGSEATFVTTTRRAWRAVRGATVGGKTIYRIRCADIAAGEVVWGELVNKPSMHVEKFGFHPWVADDIAALLPEIRVLRSGVEYLANIDGMPTLVEQSDAHMRWTLKLRAPNGIVVEWWADLLAYDPVVKCWGKIVWSDRADTNYNTVIDAISFTSREMFLLDFGRRHGASVPVATQDGKWAFLLSGSPITLQDGTGLPLSGVMLAYPQGNSATLPDADLTTTFGNLMAAAEGPIVGVAMCWDGYWGANKNVPRFGANYISQRDAEWNRFVQDQGNPAGLGWFTPRPLALGPTPWQTGDQEDFGATKGTYAVTEHDPRFIRVMQYSVYSELFRGINLYETDGTPLLAARHPNWTTWNGVTHFSPGVSPDRLGKSTTSPAGSGWVGYDDEHRSQNNLAAYALLTDDPLAQNQIRAQYELDAASYRSRYPNYGQGAARAQGRLAGAFAQLMGVTSGAEYEAWSKLLMARMKQSAAVGSMQNGPMFALAVGAPDARKQIYRNGQLAPWVSMWEHGLAAVGMYCAYKMLPMHAETDLVLRRVCHTLLTFGCFNRDNQWYTVDDILWSDGAAPPNGMRLDLREMTGTLGAGGTGTWTFAGILVARELLGCDPDIDEYVEVIARNAEATDRRTAEWWAAVKKVI